MLFTDYINIKVSFMSQRVRKILFLMGTKFTNDIPFEITTTEFYFKVYGFVLIMKIINVCFCAFFNIKRVGPTHCTQKL